jgi:hypothetical protein
MLWMDQVIRVMFMLKFNIFCSFSIVISKSAFMTHLSRLIKVVERVKLRIYSKGYIYVMGVSSNPGDVYAQI